MTWGRACLESALACSPDTTPSPGATHAGRPLRGLAAGHPAPHLCGPAGAAGRSRPQQSSRLLGAEAGGAGCRAGVYGGHVGGVPRGRVLRMCGRLPPRGAFVPVHPVWSGPPPHCTPPLPPPPHPRRASAGDTGAAADCLGPIPQSHFLLGLGMQARLEQLLASATPEQAEALQAGFRCGDARWQVFMSALPAKGATCPPPPPASPPPAMQAAGGRQRAWGCAGR